MIPHQDVRPARLLAPAAAGREDRILVSAEGRRLPPVFQQAHDERMQTGKLAQVLDFAGAHLGLIVQFWLEGTAGAIQPGEHVLLKNETFTPLLMQGGDMHRDELMKADLFSEVLLVASVALLMLPVLVTLVLVVNHYLSLP